ncbi:hypothetical protein [Streptomyces xanthophaeus]|uniref:hypothetical protein n=1 Tax=Streptomyces xanthophaeus TaxID=67385 RepID=UPI00233EE69B|nr:hypothetical protein [Streptomyces xanthophaeus]
MVDDEPAFELSFYCGTCPLLFRRLETAREKLSLESMQERLNGALDDPDDGGVIEAFGAMLPEGEYLPLLLDVEPRLVIPGKEGDYFSGEQVTTWGIDQFWGLAHIYEFVVPVVPPTWNERERVEEYAALMERETVPTAVAISTLDVCQPAVDRGDDYFVHGGLTHFLLDGHHKLEAAATAGRPVRLFSLLTLGESPAGAEEAARLPALRAQPRSGRATR